MGDPWVRVQKLYEKERKARESKQERKKDELSCFLRLKLKETFALVETERLLKWDSE